MRYALLLKPHPNVRYRQSLQKLAVIEMASVLSAWGMEESKPAIVQIAGDEYLTFETGSMTQEAWQDISCHSGICFASEVLENGLLKPLTRTNQPVLPDDLPHVLKYKGKTNADFTYMMLHCAKAVSAFAREREPLTVLDPMCGKATTLFCALCEGNHAVGIETDAKALAEAAGYYERFLKFHHLKHKRSESSRTLRKGGSARCISFEAIGGKQDEQQYLPKSVRLDLINGDASRLSEMVKANSCHLIVCDLPYGVQHAPKENGSTSSFQQLLFRAALGGLHALKAGGAAAFSFNMNTLPRKAVEQAFTQAGFDVLFQPPYHDFSHWVEQAIDRDVVVARKPQTL